MNVKTLRPLVRRATSKVTNPAILECVPIIFDTAAFDAGVDALIMRLRHANQRAVTDGAHIIQATEAKKLHAGYGVRSGTMRRSGRVRGPYRRTPDRAEAQVGPTVIYARRFELGFVGPDSLGRIFPYRPRPTWKPARIESKPLIEAIFVARFREALKG